MRLALCFLPLICCACSSQQNHFVEGPSILSTQVIAGSHSWAITYPEEADIIKQLEHLDDELQRSRHELAVHKKQVAILREAYHQLQIQFIGRRVEVFEASLDRLRKDRDAYSQLLRHQLPQLFIQEREALAQMMDNDQNFAGKGQVVMDRILRIITQLNKDKEALSQVK